MHPDEWRWANAPRIGVKPGPFKRRDTYDPLVMDDGPYGTFEAHEDVFGDGSIVAVPTPAPTPGHTSFVVTLSDRSFLITGDCAWVDLDWSEPTPKGSFGRVVDRSWRRNHAQLWRIHLWAERSPDLTVLAGHEPSNLERLLPWPEPYR